MSQAVATATATVDFDATEVLLLPLRPMRPAGVERHDSDVFPTVPKSPSPQVTHHTLLNVSEASGAPTLIMDESNSNNNNNSSIPRSEPHENLKQPHLLSAPVLTGNKKRLYFSPPVGMIATTTSSTTGTRQVLTTLLNVSEPKSAPPVRPAHFSSATSTTNQGDDKEVYQSCNYPVTTSLDTYVVRRLHGTATAPNLFVPFSLTPDVTVNVHIRKKVRCFDYEVHFVRYRTEQYETAFLLVKIISFRGVYVHAVQSIPEGGRTIS
jgi:hypothetical protein